jgi:hypothetical protein
VLERVIVVPEDQEVALSKEGISHSDIRYLIENGDVDFSESIKRSNPKIYVFDGETKGGKEVRLYLTLPSESFISEVHFSESMVQRVKNSHSGFGKMIYFPKVDQLVFMDTTNVLDQQRNELGIPDVSELFKWVKSSGKIDFSQTNFQTKPKVEHVVTFKDDKGKNLAFKAVWYKEKINVIGFGVSDRSFKKL